ncbi:hypothetical protein ACROYT_G006891 [Oculina patagonica]
MVSPLSKAWDVMPVEADHSKELLHSGLGINHGEISDRLDFLGVRNTTIKGDNMTEYFKEIRKCGLHEPLEGSSGCLETKGHGDELE